MSWILVWVFLGYSGNLEVRIPYAVVKEVVLDSEDECQKALVHQLDVNDTRYMIAHHDAKLVCVPLPGRWDIQGDKFK